MSGPPLTDCALAADASFMQCQGAQKRRPRVATHGAGTREKAGLAYILPPSCAIFGRLSAENSIYPWF